MKTAIIVVLSLIGLFVLAVVIFSAILSGRLSEEERKEEFRKLQNAGSGIAYKEG